MAKPRQQKPGEILMKLEVGQIVTFPSPFDLDPDEKIELLVTKVRPETGIIELTAHYMGVQLKSLAAKINPDGSVIWQEL